MSKPQEYQWGKQGETPTLVYKDYPWIIMSMDEYRKTK